MKQIILLITNARVIVCVSFVSLTITLHSCNVHIQKENAGFSDNAELYKMVQKDQEMRQNDSPNTELVDKVHRLEVMNLLANGQVRTNKDKLRAALILQHTALVFCSGKLISISTENYYLAYQLAKSVFDSGYKKNADMVAVTYDRYLLYTKGYQKYGTQRVNDENTNKEVWAPIDSTTTDSERAIYSIKPLNELLKEYKMKPFVRQNE